MKPQLLEDIEWAIDTIGKNKLNTGADKSLIFDEKRPEIRAQIDLIKLRNFPQKIEERSRLQALEDDERKKKSKKSKRNLEKQFDPEDTQKMLLSTGSGAQRMGKTNNLSRGLTQVEVDEDREFMQLSDELEAMGQENIYMALGGNLGEQWEEISFNVLEFCNHMAQNGIPFMFYRICKYYDFY